MIISSIYAVKDESQKITIFGPKNFGVKRCVSWGKLSEESRKERERERTAGEREPCSPPKRSIIVSTALALLYSRKQLFPEEDYDGLHTEQ